MTHSVSTAIGTHAGTALGRATNGIANRVANQTSTTTRRQNLRAGTGARTARHQTWTAPPAGTASGNGSLIASIQGGEQQRTTCPSMEKAKAQSGSKPCEAQPSHGTDAHPAVVNLPAPQ